MRSKKKLIAAASSVCFAAMMSLTAYASGDVAGAVQSTWTTARSQVVSVVNNVVFPVIDVILAVLLFVKITLAYLDYRKHGQLEWTPIAIIFGCLIFSLTCPLYIWSVCPLLHLMLLSTSSTVMVYVISVSLCFIIVCG